MAPKVAIWPADPHTKAKHGLLRHYLNAWFPILAASGKDRVVFLDGFAGPGVYQDGEPGSPIVALDTLLGHRAFPRLATTQFDFVFLEPDHDRFASLTAVLTKHRNDRGGWPPNVRVTRANLTFEQGAASMLGVLEQARASLAPTFAFVDPFGFSGTPLALLCRLLAFDSCEVLFTFMIDAVNRFITHEEVSPHLQALFGTDEYRNAATLTGTERTTFLKELYERQLRTRCKFTYVRSFELVTYRNRIGYYLVFGTRSLVGLSRMKDAMWKVDPGAGIRFSDRFAGQEVLFAGENVDVAPLRRALLRRFAGCQVSVDEINRFVLRETPYRESDWNQRVLRPLEQEGRLQVVTSPRRRPFTFPKGTVVRFPDPE
jgi:three-Cys-motif partner protein